MTFVIPHGTTTTTPHGAITYTFRTGETMPETTTPAADDSGRETEASDTRTGDEAKDWKAEAEKLTAEARKWEGRAKANASAAKELEQLRQQSMSETEKAVAQARAEGRAEALAAAMGRLASAEIRAAAAGRLTDEQLEALLEATNTAVFIGEDGDIDRAKVQRFVDGIAPPLTEEPVPAGFPDLGQGARSGSLALNGDPLLRDLKAKLGIR